MHLESLTKVENKSSPVLIKMEFLLLQKFKRQKINKYFYWLTNTKLNKHIKNRFERQEIYALSDNFM